MASKKSSPKPKGKAKAAPNVVAVELSLAAVYRGPLSAVEIPGLGIVHQGEGIPEADPRFALAASTPGFQIEEAK